MLRSLFAPDYSPTSCIYCFCKYVCSFIFIILLSTQKIKCHFILPAPMFSVPFHLPFANADDHLIFTSLQLFGSATPQSFPDRPRCIQRPMLPESASRPPCSCSSPSSNIFILTQIISISFYTPRHSSGASSLPRAPASIIFILYSSSSLHIPVYPAVQ